MSDHDVTFMVEITDAVDAELSYLKRKWIRTSRHTSFHELFTALCEEVKSGCTLSCLKVYVGCKHGVLDPGHFVEADPDYPVRIVDMQEANFVQFTAEKGRKKITASVADCMSRLPLQIALPQQTKQATREVTGFMKQTMLTAMTLMATGLVSLGWYMASVYITISMRFIIIPLLSYTSGRWSRLKNKFIFHIHKVLLMTGRMVGKRWLCLFDNYLPYPREQIRKYLELL